MKKISFKFAAVVIAAIVAFIYYYIALPAFNIHSSGFWMFIIVAVIVLTAAFSMKKIRIVNNKFEIENGVRNSKIIKLGTGVLAALILILIIGTILSSPIVNADRYQKLITVETREFTDDIQEVDYNQIPLLDKDSAALLGNRKMGSMVEYVSQFEVSTLYTQINYQGKPVRVTPLVYASPIKWLTNQSSGIPAYIMIDMTTQDTECIQLENNIKYSQSEYFNRNIYRHLRLHYPTYIFDSINFEIDDNGVPYWICPAKKFNIGLFGGQTIGQVVLCNATTGETTSLAVEDVPAWVDRVYSAELLISLYDYYGSLKHGYFNSILGQRDCLRTTDGYNYIAKDDDVWVYTGVTSVSGDESNVGFVLMNQRTMETRYYSCTGAEEYSAMSSAEGQVQHLGYQATFPLLLNIAGEPTYFLALKDNAGLVKKYAMVNIQKYQNVAIGDTVAECEKTYIALLKTNNITKTDTSSIKTKTGIISKIAQGVIDGNTHYYIILTNSDEIFDITLAEYIDVVRFSEGDRITLEYVESTESNTVLGIEE